MVRPAGLWLARAWLRLTGVGPWRAGRAPAREAGPLAGQRRRRRPPEHRLTLPPPHDPEDFSVNTTEKSSGSRTMLGVGSGWRPGLLARGPGAGPPRARPARAGWP